MCDEGHTEKTGAHTERHESQNQIRGHKSTNNDVIIKRVCRQTRT